MSVWLVPHTHWDREWYEPFQRFRLRLVDLMDDVVARAEADPAFHFTLDGQLAVVDDYLEIRPEARERIAKLVASGQFAIGPWAILMDEFLCSGENMVRNLEWGLSRAAELGGAMPVGYLPDMFGHCAQMPQILAGAGLTQACVWRGVPSSVDRHAFAWHAPDGTRLRTEYLPGGYGNAAGLIADPTRIAEATAEHVNQARPWFGDDPILAMYGTDHSAPLPWLSSTVAHADDLRLATLAQYLALFDPSDVEGLPVWTGEMRSHARANILPGVISNRPHLKRALAAAERIVERYAEPLAALHLPAQRWPGSLLELAWHRLIQSSCHDSVTGCGVDETAVQVAARIAEAEQIGTAIVDRVLGERASHTPEDAAFVFNPSPQWRLDLVTVDLPVPEDWTDVALEQHDGKLAPCQEIGRNDTTLFETVRPASWLRAGLGKATLGLEFLGREVQRVEVTGERELTVTMGRTGPGLPADPSLVKADGDWTLRAVEEPLRRLIAAVGVNGLGHSTARAVPGKGFAYPEVTASERRLANHLLSVEVAGDGTLTLSSVDGTVLSGVGRLVDGGDIGDLYNYAPDGPLRDTPESVAVAVKETGPLLAALEVTRVYPWGVPVMRVELRAMEQFARVEVTFVNNLPDHRVRFHVPLADPSATESYAEGQFAVVRRGLESEGGHGEVPLPTFPASSFVDCGGAAVLLLQATEYEVTGGELALTLLRATGSISRAEHPLRLEPAGPVIATPQAQLIGAEIRTAFAIFPHAEAHAGDWSRVVPAAEAYRHPFLAVRGLGPVGGGIGVGGKLLIDGTDGVVLSSLRRRDDDWLEVRMVAMTDEPASVDMLPARRMRRADLLGNPGEPVEAGTVRLRPWEIATIQICDS